MTDRSPLLGRHDLLERVDALLAQCRGGRGGLLWLHGDAGIGKTRLLAEVEARAAGALVLRGTGWEDPGTPSFWIWSQVLRAAAAVHPPDGWSGRGERARALLDGRAGGLADAAGRFPLFDAVARVLDDLAHERPLVLVLDDVHWADEGSLRLLHFLTADLASRSVLVACGWRDHEPDTGPERLALVAEVTARGESWLPSSPGTSGRRRPTSSCRPRP